MSQTRVCCSLCIVHFVKVGLNERWLCVLRYGVFFRFIAAL